MNEKQKIEYGAQLVDDLMDELSTGISRDTLMKITDILEEKSKSPGVQLAYLGQVVSVIMKKNNIPDFTVQAWADSLVECVKVLKSRGAVLNTKKSS